MGSGATKINILLPIAKPQSEPRLGLMAAQKFLTIATRILGSLNSAELYVEPDCDAATDRLKKAARVAYNFLAGANVFLETLWIFEAVTYPEFREIQVMITNAMVECSVAARSERSEVLDRLANAHESTLKAEKLAEALCTKFRQAAA
jgi:hypothetical protein